MTKKPTIYEIRRYKDVQVLGNRIILTFTPSEQKELFPWTTAKNKMKAKKNTPKQIKQRRVTDND